MKEDSEAADRREELLAKTNGLIGRELSQAEKDALFLARSAGGTVIEDLSGRSFHDLTSGGGTCLLGFAAPVIQDALKEGLARGLPRTAWQAEGIEVAFRLRELFGRPDRVVLCGGAQAARELAAKAVRHATGREKILMVGGSQPVAGDIRRVDAGDLAALDKGLAEDSDGIAALLMEPLCNDKMKPEDMEIIRQRANELGVPLILDESLTAFRLAPFAVHIAHGIPGDLVCLGESMAGGLPLGALMGRADLLDPMAREPDCVEPLALSAAAALLDFLAGEPVADRLAGIGEQMRSRFEESCKREELDAGLLGPPGRMRFHFADQENASGVDLGYRFLQELHHLGCRAGFELFPNLAMTATALSEILELLDRAASRMRTLLIEFNSYMSPGVPFIFPTAPPIMKERGLARYRYPKTARVNLEVKGGSLHILFAPGPLGRVTSSGFFVPTRLQGDFIATAHYRQNRWRPGPYDACLAISAQNEVINRRFYAKRHTVPGLEGDRVGACFGDIDSPLVRVNTSEGELRLVRKDGRISAWHRELGGDAPGEWLHLMDDEEEVRYDMVLAIKAWSHQESDGLEVEFRNLVVEGEVSPDQAPLGDEIPDPNQP